MKKQLTAIIAAMLFSLAAFSQQSTSDYTKIKVTGYKNGSQWLFPTNFYLIITCCEVVIRSDNKEVVTYGIRTHEKQKSLINAFTNDEKKPFQITYKYSDSEIITVNIGNMKFLGVIDLN